MRSLISTLLIFSLTVGCTTLADIRSDNRRSLSDLEIGMSETEVRRVMGSFEKQTQSGKNVTNPWRTATARTEGGDKVLLLWYYTDIKNQDGAITDDELTPVVLRADTVVGWGHSMVTQQGNEYVVRIR